MCACVCGYVGMWVCEYGGMYVCGYVGTWVRVCVPGYMHHNICAMASDAAAGTKTL